MYLDRTDFFIKIDLYYKFVGVLKIKSEAFLIFLRGKGKIVL